MTRPTLTRTEEVLKLLRHGGTIEAGERAGILLLRDRAGREVPAWQTAIKAAQQKQAGGNGR